MICKINALFTLRIKKGETKYAVEQCVCEYYGTLISYHCFKSLTVHRLEECYFGDVLLNIIVYIMEVQRCGLLFWGYAVK